MKFFTLVAGFLLLSQTEQARILTGGQVLIMTGSSTSSVEPHDSTFQPINIQSNYKTIDPNKNVI